MKRKIALIVLLPFLMLTGCDLNDKEIEEQIPPVESLLEFENCKFEDKTFTYDGKPHQLVVEGAPQGTRIVYNNNSKTAVGSYLVTANLSKEGYKNKSLTATLTIEPLKTFTGISFESQNFDYDGNVHSLILTGAPEGATISYNNNNKKDVGVYTVKASVSLTGYQTSTYSATLTIVGKQITGVTFEDATFKYDGQPHSIYVSNLPEGTKVAYSGNGKTYEGTYTVTATITGAGYEKLVLTANLTITMKNAFPDAVFSDLYWIYDNRNINVSNIFDSYEYNLKYNYTKSFTVTYKVNGVTKSEPIIKDVGTYNISATYTASNYLSKTISFKITISDQIGGVDLTKIPYQFNENSKFQDLYTEMKKGNYSVTITYRDEYDYDKDGTYETIKDSPLIHNYFVTPDAFAGRHNEDSTQFSTKDYFITKGTDYAFRYEYDYYVLSKYKFPVSNYLETVMEISDGMAPFALLQESLTGGFDPSFVGGYHDSYGTYELDSVNNRLIITSRTHYYHDEHNHDEVLEYAFYNVGNTTVSIPNEMIGRDSEKDSFETGNFIENGIEYKSNSTGFTANITLNELDDAYLGGGTYTLRAEIDGLPITEIDYDYYHYTFYVNHDNYELNVYYNNKGIYQGKYAELGQVKYYNDASKFGHINYYSDWNN